MKKSIVTFVLAIIAFVSHAEKYTQKGDSLIVQFGNNTRMIIQARDKEGILSLRQYDLNKIVRDMGAALDSSSKETYIYINEKNGRKYLKDTVLVISRKDGEVKITINESKQGSSESKAGSSDNSTNSNDDDGTVTRSVTRRYKSPRNGFDVLVGLNTYAKNTPLTYQESDYDLLPWGSRFVSLSWVRGAAISRGKDASLGLDLGIDVSWYNMMFDGNNTVQKDTRALSFPAAVASGDVYKSKLTSAYLNLSLMPTLAIHHGPISYLSVGIYGGYRLDSYTKVQERRKGHSERTHSNFHLNDFRYGFGAELGIRHFPDLFMQYDLGELYQTAKGPAVRMISFGIRL
ncbi:outer membrane beta-barrel protein [Runella slithyformis]|nr:outer membrane beta-barrel protein [Runella slithyformis]